MSNQASHRSRSSPTSHHAPKPAPQTGDLHSDTAHIRKAAEAIIHTGHKLIALAHSYGGQVCSNALHGLGVQAQQTSTTNNNSAGGVAALVYMCSWALPEGSTAPEEFGNTDLIPLVFDVDKDDMTAVPRDPGGSIRRPRWYSQRAGRRGVPIHAGAVEL